MAEEEEVRIAYEISDLSDLKFKKEEFDAIALIYTHFPTQERKYFFSSIHEYLKEGGKVIFEGFASKHSEYQERNALIGGPKDPNMFFSEEEVREAFQKLHFLEFYEGEVELREGNLHKGKGWVIRFVAKKQS